MIEKEYGYVEGSTALNPKRKPQSEQEKNYEKLKKAKQQRKLRQNNKNKKQFNQVMQVVAFIFILGTIVIYRDTKVYKMQGQVATYNRKISEINQQSEALKVNMLKASSLSEIKETSGKKLNMIIPGNDDSVKLSDDTNYFQGTKEVSNENKGQQSIISKIKDALF